MKLVCLMENTAARPEIKPAHGLSLWLETGGQKLIFDFGPGAGFLENAQALGVDPAEASLAVLSHGHYDHGGGLDAFLRRNSSAPVYVRREAFRPHTSGERDIGLLPRLEKSPRLRFSGPEERIGDGLRVFSGVTGHFPPSPANVGLLENGAPDAFEHEQHLLVEEDGRLFLIGGCAHCGIVNLMEHAARLAGRAPDVVVSGFHLSLPNRAVELPAGQLEEIARRLLAYSGTRYYTCHCTGKAAFDALHAQMGDRLQSLSAGQTVCF